MSADRQQKPFVPTDTSHPKLRKLVRDAARLFAHDGPTKRLQAALQRLRRAEQRARDEHDSVYPPDPPNAACRHAMVDGIFVQNSSMPAAGDYRPLFVFGSERIHVWTPGRDEYSVLVSEVDPSVKSVTWKTFKSALRISAALTSSFESLLELEYRWIYRFDPKTSRAEQEWLDPDGEPLMLQQGEVRSIRYLHDSATIFELLRRDDRFYTAAQNMLTAVDNHWFCQTCALQSPDRRRHANHEPPIWEFVSAIPRMEVAIVQVTRAVEAILGKPGNREDPKKLARVKARWRSAIALDPDERFDNAGTTHLNYYYELFETRGRAAHSLGNLPFSVSRELTILAQSFAWQVLLSYFKRNSVSLVEAAKILEFEESVVNSEPADWSTRLTRESSNVLAGLTASAGTTTAKPEPGVATSMTALSRRRRVRRTT